MNEDALRPRNGADGGYMDEVRAGRFTLVDARGRPRAGLGVGDDGAPALQLYDAREQPRVQLALDPSGAANLKLHDNEGEVSAWLSVGANGSPSLYLRGLARHSRQAAGHAELSVGERGCPVLSLYDTGGRPRLLLSLGEPDGAPRVSLFTADGDLRALLTGDAERGLLHLYPDDEEVAGYVGAVPSDVPGSEADSAEEADARVIEVPFAATEDAGASDEPLVFESATEAPAPPAAADPVVEPPPAVEETGADAETVANEEMADEAVLADDAEVDEILGPLADVPIPSPAFPARRPFWRRYPRAVALLFLTAAAGFLGLGALQLITLRDRLQPRAERVATPAPPPQPPAPTRTVEAAEFVLTNGEGGARARWTLLPDGSPFLQLSGRGGRSLIELSVLPAQGPVLKLIDGRALVSVRAKEDGSSEITMHGKGKEARVAFFMQEDGTPVLSMTDEEGRVRAGLTVSPDGSPSLSLYDENQLRALLGTSSAAASLLLLDRQGQVIYQAPR